MRQKLKHKDYCFENFKLYPYVDEGEDKTPYVCNLWWGGWNTTSRFQDTNFPREYPAPTCLWKLDLMTGGTEWEANVQRHTHNSDITTNWHCITVQEHGSETEFIRTPWMSPIHGGRPLFLHDENIYFGGMWQADDIDSEQEDHKPYFYFARLSDDGTTHGEMVHMPIPEGSDEDQLSRSFNDSQFIHGNYLFTGGNYENKSIMRIDLTDWSIVTPTNDDDFTSLVFTQGYACDGTHILLPDSEQIAVSNMDLSEWSKVEINQGEHVDESFGIAHVLTANSCEQPQEKVLSDSLALCTTEQGYTDLYGYFLDGDMLTKQLKEYDTIGHLTLVSPDGTIEASTEYGQTEHKPRWYYNANPAWNQFVDTTEVETNTWSHTYTIKQSQAVMRNGSKLFVLSRKKDGPTWKQTDHKWMAITYDGSGNILEVRLFDTQAEAEAFGGPNAEYREIWLPEMTDNGDSDYGDWEIEEYDLSLQLLETHDLLSFYPMSPDLGTQPQSRVYVDVFNWLHPRRPNICPLGDGDSWILSTKQGVFRQSLSSGTIWRNVPHLGITDADEDVADQGRFGPGCVSVDQVQGIVIVSGRFVGPSGAITICHAYDLETGEELWNRAFPIRSNYLNNNNNVGVTADYRNADVNMVYIRHLIDGDNLYLLTPYNHSALRYG